MRRVQDIEHYASLGVHSPAMKRGRILKEHGSGGPRDGSYAIWESIFDFLIRDCDADGIPCIAPAVCSNDDLVRSRMLGNVRQIYE